MLSRKGCPEKRYMLSCSMTELDAIAAMRQLRNFERRSSTSVSAAGGEGRVKGAEVRRGERLLFLTIA
jgi:hypothetical protein